MLTSALGATLGRDHLGIPDDIISDCAREFVGICNQSITAHDTQTMPAGSEDNESECDPRRLSFADIAKTTVYFCSRSTHWRQQH
jgi:hypothetical protein